MVGTGRCGAVSVAMRRSSPSLPSADGCHVVSPTVCQEVVAIAATRMARATTERGSLPLPLPIDSVRGPTLARGPRLSQQAPSPLHRMSRTKAQCLPLTANSFQLRTAASVQRSQTIPPICRASGGIDRIGCLSPPPHHVAGGPRNPDLRQFQADPPRILREGENRFWAPAVQGPDIRGATVAPP